MGPRFRGDDDRQLLLNFLGLRLKFRPLVRACLRVADGLGQHLAQLCLALRGCAGNGCLPVCHGHYVGMPEGEVNATGAAKSGAADINYFEDNPRPLRVQGTNPLSREGLAARSGDYLCRSNYLNERR